MIVKPTNIKEATAPLQLTQEEAKAVATNLKALDDAFKSDEKRFAKYRIQLMFGAERSIHHPIKGVITWWRSNLAFHGGGDISIYMCPGKVRKVNSCDAFMLVDAHDGERIHCHSCGTTWRSDVCIGEHFAALPLDKWADVLASYFRKLESCADITLKYAPEDIRSVTRNDIERKKHGEMIDSLRVRRERARAIYRLPNILKDVSSGSPLEHRILSFLRALP